MVIIFAFMSDASGAKILHLQISIFAISSFFFILLIQKIILIQKWVKADHGCGSPRSRHVALFLGAQSLVASHLHKGRGFSHKRSGKIK